MDSEEFEPKPLRDGANEMVNVSQCAEMSTAPAKDLLNLIVKILINATLKECYEEGDKIS